VTAGADGAARVWDSSTGAAVATLRGHTDAVQRTSFSPDGLRVLTESLDGTARVWDARAGDDLTALRELYGNPLFMSFSPDLTRLVTLDNQPNDARCGTPGRGQRWPACGAT